MTNELVTQAKQEIVPLEQEVSLLVVKDDATRTQAVDIVKSIKLSESAIEQKFHFRANTKQAHTAWKSAKDTENSVYVPLDDLTRTVKGKVQAYDRQVALDAQKAQRLAEAKQAELERKERERLQAKADKALEKGKIEQAEALLDEAETVVIAPPPTPAAKPTKKLIWKATVKNPLQLCTAISAGIVPTTVIQVNQAALNAFAKGYNGTDVIPGLQFTQEVDSRIR